MIISEPRQPFDLKTKKISLPAWALAPLSLNRGARFWGIYGTPPQHHLHQRALELILTTIHPRFWSDLWRLEFTTDDRIGNLEKIADLLHHLSVEIIASEGSIHSVAKFHSMTFILSLRNYSSPVDGDTEARMKRAHFIAKNLEFLIKANFADQIVFNDAGFPRFKLKRLNLYRGMASRDLLLSNYEKLCEDSGLVLTDVREVDPPEPFVNDILSLGPDIYYTSAVDTKDRVIRTLFFSKHERAPAHIQFATYGFNSLVLYTILKLIADRLGNVIRYQIRRGLNENAQGLLGRLAEGKPKDHRKQQPARIDLTIEPRQPDMSTADWLSALVEAVRADRVLEQAFVDVTKMRPREE